MIIDSNNKIQTSIITNKCFYQTISSIMRELEDKGYQNCADETLKVISAYHSLVGKKGKNDYSSDYNAAFKYIDTAIESVAYQVFSKHAQKKFDFAYKSFEEFDYINAILNRQHIKKSV